MKTAAVLLAGVGLFAAGGLWLSGGLGGRQSALNRLNAEIDARLEETAGEVHRRAVALAAVRRLSAAIPTDEATMNDMAAHELAFLHPAPGEVIEVWRAPKEDVPLRLLVIPREATFSAAMERRGVHLSIAGGELMVSEVAALPPHDATADFEGVLAVSRPVDLGAVARHAEALGWSIQLEVSGLAFPLAGPAVRSAPNVERPLGGRLAGEATVVIHAPHGEGVVFQPGTQAAAAAALGLGAAAVLWRRKRPLQPPPPPPESRRYRMLRQVAKGGMGEVWEALAVGSGGFQRKVMIKRVFPDRQADDSLRRMFIDEARIASNLHHANIVAVSDFGVSDGHPFQVLEFVDGADLERICELCESGERMPVELALHVCVQVAHALHYAHEAVDAQGAPLGIVHRDVSPDNVLVSWAGDVKLSDFGIALAEGRLEKTAEGLAKGKLSYMAPEQATRGTVDRRADVFSLGCVLYRVVQGVSPLEGDDEGILALLSGEELTLDPTLPEELRPLLTKALRRSRLDRYETAGAMAEEMSTVLAARRTRDARLALSEFMEKLRPRLDTLAAARRGETPTEPVFLPVDPNYI